VRRFYAGISVLLYYMVFAASVALDAVLWGAEWNLNGTLDFTARVFAPNIATLSNKELLLISFILPYIVTAGLCLLQIFAGFFVSPVVSFACMCGIYVLSAYYTTWFFPGSYTMWIRSAYIASEGVQPVSGMVLGLLLIFGTQYIGKLYFEGKDIF